MFGIHVLSIYLMAVGLLSLLLFILLWQRERRDDSRVACTAGRSRAMSSPMIAITTKSSTSVKPLLCVTELAPG